MVRVCPKRTALIADIQRRPRWTHKTTKISSMTRNPWNNLTKCSYHVAVCDKACILDVNNSIHNTDDKFHLELWPEPFVGNPKAQVYLLNGNPGYTAGKDELFAKDIAFQSLVKNSIVHNTTAGCDDFIYFNEIKCNGEEHPGCEWWMKRTKQLRLALGRNPRLFNVEFCPYHSKNANNIPEYLPSYEYTNHLVISAINDTKIIIAMLMVNRWIARIPQLKNYPNLYRLLNSRNVCLTSGNVVSITSSFGTLLNAC